jgi:hypothetical protein
VAGKNRTNLFIFFSSDLTYVFLLGKGVRAKEKRYYSNLMWLHDTKGRISECRVQSYARYAGIRVENTAFLQDLSIP